MIPLNEYQTIIYEKLSDTKYNVFDEVPTDEELPLISIGDYTLSTGDVKYNSYIVNQYINMYSDYSGKKEINEIVSYVASSLLELINVDINDAFYICDVSIQEMSVSRHEEGFYVANANIKFELEGK